jgi:hypothetical protein
MPSPAHRIETILQRDGTLTLEHLPFKAGQAVEVIILPQTGIGQTSQSQYPFRGVPVRLEGATEADWEALR